MGTSQTKKYKCIGSNMVNHAQDWSWVKKFFDLPNKHIPIVDVVRFMAAGVFSKCMTSLNDYCCRDPFVHHRINDDIKKWIRKVSRIIKFK